MRRLLAIVVAAIALTGAPFAAGVVGGVPADPTTGDHVVALLEVGADDGRAGQFCTGTLIEPQWVVTAGHCTYGLRPEQMQVAAGRVALAAVTADDRYPVDAIATYPLYDPRRWGHDIALVHLARPVPASIHPAAERYQRGPRASYASDGWVSGWGASVEAPTGSPTLLTGRISISTPAHCRALGAPWGTICGTLPFSSEPAACWGDSGGPLESSGVLVGVVSFGPEGCDNSAPTAYTHVGTYSTWIDHVRAGGDPRVSLPEVTRVTARQVPGTRWTRLTMRWCQSGGIGHRIITRFKSAHGDSGWHYSGARSRIMRGRCGGYAVVHRHAHRPGEAFTIYADVRDATTGMRYFSTYPVRIRIA